MSPAPTDIPLATSSPRQLHFHSASLRQRTILIAPASLMLIDDYRTRLCSPSIISRHFGARLIFTFCYYTATQFRRATILYFDSRSPLMRLRHDR
jgi:hypothetical protein